MGERPAALEITVQRESGHVVLELDGELDVSGIALLRRRLRPLADHVPARVVVDMSCLTFLESSGVRELLSAADLMADGATLCIAGADAGVSAILRLADPHHRLRTFATVSEAAAWLEQR